MKWAHYFHESRVNLLAAKLRSLLALLGILIGTASVVAMVSGGQLAANETLKQFKTLGIDLLSVSISDADESGKGFATTSLSLSQAQQLQKTLPAIKDIAPYTQQYSHLQFKQVALNGGVLGVTSHFSSLIKMDLLAGRSISDLDQYAFYCVLGNGLYQQIKPHFSGNLIGQQIQIGKNLFTIIGIAKPWQENSFVFVNLDRSVLIPVLNSLLLNQYTTINNVLMRLTPQAKNAKVQADVEHFLQTALPNKKFYFRNAQELITHMEKQSAILTIFLGMIGGISLLVGGMGVMNIMLVSVIERRREIGIRLAIGATPANIRTLFLMEAVILALTGGGVGVFLGLLIAYLIAWFSHWEFTFFLLPPFIGFIVSAGIGIFFGLYPAHKASKLDPIQALRME